MHLPLIQTLLIPNQWQRNTNCHMKQKYQRIHQLRKWKSWLWKTGYGLKWRPEIVNGGAILEQGRVPTTWTCFATQSRSCGKGMKGLEFQQVRKIDLYTLFFFFFANFESFFSSSLSRRTGKIFPTPKLRHGHVRKVERLEQWQRRWKHGLIQQRNEQQHRSWRPRPGFTCSIHWVDRTWAFGQLEPKSVKCFYFWISICHMPPLLYANLIFNVIAFHHFDDQFASVHTDEKP